VGVLLFCGPKFRERGFWNVPPVGTFPAINLVDARERERERERERYTHTHI